MELRINRSGPVFKLMTIQNGSSQIFWVFIIWLGLKIRFIVDFTICESEKKNND